MAERTVRLRGSSRKFKVLLSNGSKSKVKDLLDGDIYILTNARLEIIS